VEPVIISKLVFNIAERGLFSGCFGERSILLGSLLTVVNDGGSSRVRTLKSCCREHCRYPNLECLE
jgi:hypothetical protein